MNPVVRPASGETRNPALATLIGAAWPALAVVTVVALVALGVADRAGSASVLVGGSMVLVALAVGPLLQHLCRHRDPAVVLGIAVLAYCLVVGLIGFGFSILNDRPWLHGPWAAAGALGAGIAWTAGQMRTVTRLRQHLYDLPDTSVGN